MKRIFHTDPDLEQYITSARDRRNICWDMFHVLEYPDTYGLSKRRSKGSKTYEITVTIRAVRRKKPS